MYLLYTKIVLFGREVHAQQLKSFDVVLIF